jgi:hypothetical protein
MPLALAFRISGFPESTLSNTTPHGKEAVKISKAVDASVPPTVQGF